MSAIAVAIAVGSQMQPLLSNAGRRQERVDVGSVTARYKTRSVPAGAIAIEREVQSKRPTRDAFPPYKTGVGKDF